MCLLTDYGLDDEWVGVLHRVVRAVVPGVEIVDLTHGIARHDVRAGALALWRAAPWLAPAVVLAVVDPGVATARRAVAIDVATDRSRLSLVGPDNGLLTPAAHRSGRILGAVELTDPRWHVPPGPGVGTTFAGRDVFAPVAAHLAAGVPLADVGTAIDPAGLAGGPVRLARPDRSGVVEATVLWVDAFGNVQLDVAAGDLIPGVLAPGGAVAVQAVGGGPARPATVAAAYADLGDRLGLIPDSAGLLALCLDRRSAAEHLGLRAGDAVVLRPWSA